MNLFQYPVEALCQLNKVNVLRRIILFIVLFLCLVYNGSLRFSSVCMNNVAQFKEYDFNITFVETNESSTEINLKQLCALESAARHNPNAKVYLYTVRNKSNINDVKMYNDNIEMVLIDLNKIFVGTPLEKWWQSGKLNNKNPHQRVLHLSDALRLLLVWKNGGVYMDTDMYTLDTYEDLVQHESLCLYKSVDEIFVNNAFFTGRRNSRYFYEAMEYYAQNYHADTWADNGPSLIHKFTHKYCNITWGQERSHLLLGDKSTTNPVKTFKFDYPKNNTCKFYLLPSYVMYPYFFSESYELFQPDASISVDRYLYSRAIHTSTTQSQGYGIGQNKSQIDFFCRFNCPRTYTRMTKQ